MSTTKKLYLFVGLILVSVIVKVILVFRTAVASTRLNDSIQIDQSHQSHVLTNVTAHHESRVQTNVTTHHQHLVQTNVKSNSLLNVRNCLPNYFTQHNNNSLVNTFHQNTTAVVFFHVPKSAGTTMNRCLETVAKDTNSPQTQHIWTSNYISFYEKLKSGRHTRTTSYFGIFSFGLCNYIEAPCSYFTILRDPIQRVISWYFYCQEETKDAVCKVADARSHTIHEWVSIIGNAMYFQFLHNSTFCSSSYYTKAIGQQWIKAVGMIRHVGIPMPCWYKQRVVIENILSEDKMDRHLHFIIANLENWFSVIGLSEKYDLTLQMLEAAYRRPYYEVCSTNKNNIGKYNSSLDIRELETQLRNDAHIKKILSKDLEIYDAGVKIFNEQIKQMKS